MTARVTNCGRLTHRYGDLMQGCSEVNLTLWMTFVVGTWQATLLNLFLVLFFFPLLLFYYFPFLLGMPYTSHLQEHSPTFLQSCF